jgi:hypothetical protein
MENMFVRKIRRLPIQGENSLSKKMYDSNE